MKKIDLPCVDFLPITTEPKIANPHPSLALGLNKTIMGRPWPYAPIASITSKDRRTHIKETTQHQNHLVVSSINKTVFED
eukprot:1507698-Amphidinium_carterae.1